MLITIFIICYILVGISVGILIAEALYFSEEPDWRVVILGIGGGLFWPISLLSLPILLVMAYFCDNIIRKLNSKLPLNKRRSL